jgi:hypothetical protein
MANPRHSPHHRADTFLKIERSLKPESAAATRRGMNFLFFANPLARLVFHSISKNQVTANQATANQATAKSLPTH